MSQYNWIPSGSSDFYKNNNPSAYLGWGGTNLNPANNVNYDLRVIPGVDNNVLVTDKTSTLPSAMTQSQNVANSLATTQGTQNGSAVWWNPFSWFGNSNDTNALSGDAFNQWYNSLNTGTAFGDLPSDVQTKYLNSFLSQQGLGQMKNLSWTVPFNAAMQLGSSLFGGYQAYQQSQAAKKAAERQWDMARKNFNNNITLLEEQRSDRYNNRSMFSGRPVQPGERLERV